VVLQGYYSTTWARQEYYWGNTTGIPWGTTGILQGYYWGATGLLLGFTRSITGVPLEYYLSTSGVPLGYYLGTSELLSWGTAGILLGCCRSTSGVLRLKHYYGTAGILMSAEVLQLYITTGILLDYFWETSGVLLWYYLGRSGFTAVLLGLCY